MRDRICCYCVCVIVHSCLFVLSWYLFCLLYVVVVFKVNVGLFCGFLCPGSRSYFLVYCACAVIWFACMINKGHALIGCDVGLGFPLSRSSGVWAVLVIPFCSCQRDRFVVGIFHRVTRGMR